MSYATADPSTATTLSDKSIKYVVPEEPYAQLSRGDVRIVVVDNREVKDDVLPAHRSGYSGVASLTYKSQARNLFVPAYAGLNFEHIHDGTKQTSDVLFEPRRAPMELRRIDDHTVELYQAPSPTWALESCQRIALLDDGAIEVTFECIPRRKTFANNYIGLFWASYIDKPESMAIHFMGVDDPPADNAAKSPRWIEGVTPAHGVLSTHLAVDDARVFKHDDPFPMTLVFNRSKHRYARPWYFGVSHGMAYALVFRAADGVRMTQSPSGGGGGNPAWDFQWFIEDYKVGKRYQLVMRALYFPYESREQAMKVIEPHERALNPLPKPR